MTVSTYEELVAALLTETEITLGASIEVPGGETLIIDTGKSVSIDMKNFTISATFNAPYSKNFDVILVKSNATLTLKDGTVSCAGAGDTSYAKYVNGISMIGGHLVANNVKFISDIVNGIAACLDINTAGASTPASATLTDCELTAKRYCARLFACSAKNLAALTATNCKFTGGSTGPFIQSASSNVEAKAEVTLNKCEVSATKGFYIWDTNKNAPAGDETIIVTLGKGTTLKATATADPAGDAYMPGYDKEIMVDYSGGQHADRVKVIDQRVGYHQPFSITYKNKYKRGGRVIE